MAASWLADPTRIAANSWAGHPAIGRSTLSKTASGPDRESHDRPRHSARRSRRRLDRSAPGAVSRSAAERGANRGPASQTYLAIGSALPACLHFSTALLADLDRLLSTSTEAA